MKLLESKFILNTIENKNIASYSTNEITYNNYIYEDGSIVSETKKARRKRREDEKQKTLNLKINDFISCLILSSKDFKKIFFIIWIIG
ncbi:hypothetical protein [Spiroplasma endosymbiont of Danaus chrysippus]|uniref:hypothetical protein n=1 Tax=Spiroplasma endosymbiont of Danaus chrysippus TaxID=2691041 RepID=UPI00157A53A2|nr:hypothetical protein [Spiroplasma endosymbiont of Danaus chrysippus]